MTDKVSSIGPAAPEGPTAMRPTRTVPQAGPHRNVARPGLLDPLRDGWRNRSLIRALVMAAEKAQFHRMSLGMAWKYIEPVFFVLTYYLFMVAMRGTAQDSGTIIALIMSGMMVFEWMRKTIMGSTSVFVTYNSLCTTTNIPLITIILASVYQNTVSTYPLWLMTLLTIGLVFGGLTWHIILLPVIGVLFALVLIPLSVSFAFFGTYFRDMSKVIDLAIRILLFLSPVLYDLATVPERMRGVMIANPLTIYIEATRDVLWRGVVPGYKPFLAMTIVAAGLWLLALVVLQRIGRRVVKVL